MIDSIHMTSRIPEPEFINFQSLPDIDPELIIKSGLALLPRLSKEGNSSDQAYVHYRIGIARITRGEYESAFRSLSEARQLHDNIGDMEGVLRDQLAFGIIYGLSEQPEVAFETFLSIRDKSRDLDLPEIEETADCNMGRICCNQKRFDEGIGFLNTALKLIEGTGNRDHKAAVLHELGRIALNQGHLETAAQYLEEANHIVSAEQESFSYEFLISLGELYTLSSRFEEASKYLTSALDLCRQHGIRHGEIQALYQLGNFYYETGDSEKASEYWKNCYKLTDSLNIRQYRILSGERLVDYYRQSGKHEQALDCLENIRCEERKDRNERLHHTISVYDQSMRIDDLEQEMHAWRRRSGELEKIRSNREESIRELETIKEIGEELTASLDPDQIVKVLNNRLSQLAAVNSLLIAFYLENEQEMDIRYIIENGKRLEPIRCPVKLDESLSSWVILKDQDLLIKTREEIYNYTKQIYHVDGNDVLNESFLIVRLKIEGRIIGVLSVQATARNCYRERHLKVLQALAGFVAIALSNSNAHQSLVLANEKIAHLATHDPMTGLPNRMQIMDRLEQELKRGRRYKKALAVLFIDLDGFKLINDTHGHRVGDSVLKKIADRLSSGVRATDAVGRLAGDEFLVILTDDCTPENGLQLAEQLRTGLSQKIIFENQSLQVTGSIGLAFFPEDGKTPEELINAADQAMYDAKAEGRNRTSLHSSQSTMQHPRLQ